MASPGLTGGPGTARGALLPDEAQHAAAQPDQQAEKAAAAPVTPEDK